MSIDAYSLCPGGTGKKIKFCCNDILPELQKIDRMIEGEQYNACLQHIETLLAKEPGRDRECLLATKCLMERVVGQMEASHQTAEAFLTKYPNNQVALAEMAIQSVDGNVLAAFGLLQRAMHAADGNLTSRVYQAIGAVGAHMLDAGFPLSARALFQLQCQLMPSDNRPVELLGAFSQAADIPVLLRDEPPIAPPAENAPWAGKFEHAMTFATVGDWQTAAAELASLAPEAKSAVLWLDLAILRGWLADNDGAIEALRQYAALRADEPDGLEDASEALAKAMFLSGDPLGDRVDMLNISWTVKDADRVLELLLSSAQWQPLPFDPAMFRDENNPPPKGAYMLLDRPMPTSPDGVTRETMPSMIGQALLYGRQTDREARLEVVGISADDFDMVAGMIQKLVGEFVEPEPKKNVISHFSASQQALLAPWQPPRGMTPDTLEAMMAEHVKDTILNRWPARKLGALDGRSPFEAAGDPACRTRLMAAVLILQTWSERLPGVPDFNELRTKLGLPTLGEIHLYAEHAIWELPLVRLNRLSADGMSDQSLAAAYHRAAAYAVQSPAEKFAKAIVERTTFADAETRMAAYATLVRSERDIAKAREYVEQARQAMDAMKVSHASWDLMELSLSFGAKDVQNAMRLIDHIQRNHIEEPGVAESLTRLLISVGLLRPDGSPAYGPAGGPGAAAAPMAAEPPAASSGLWTPDNDVPNPPAGGTSKLWTPD